MLYFIQIGLLFSPNLISQSCGTTILPFPLPFALPFGPLRSLSLTMGFGVDGEEALVDAALGVAADDDDPPGKGIMWY